MVQIPITENIHILVGGTFPYCNSLVLIGEQITIIDPGCPIDLLTSFLKQKNLELRNIDSIVLSHIHPDHITFAARIQRLSKCRIIANEITASLFNDKEKMKEFLGFHKLHPIRPFWENLVNECMFGALDTHSQVDYVLGKNERFDAGGIVFRPLMTPGHLPDHMCIEFPKEEIIFGADIDCTPFGPYYQRK